MKAHIATGALLAALLGAGATAEAQAARADVSRGGVDGVEMQLEGSLSATRGGTLRWLVTAYEVRGLSELRPAAGATVHVATSLAQTEDAAEVTTDPSGRARVALEVPEDAEDQFRVVLRLVHANGIQRRYELGVRVTPREAIALHVARQRVSPGGVLRAFGRLTHRESARPLGGETLRLTLRDDAGRPLAAPVEVRSDEAGLFAHRFDVPDDHRGAVSVEARTSDDDHPLSRRVGAQVAVPTPPPLLLAVAPGAAIVAPGARVPIEVVVRTPMGRPLPGTTVTLAGARREDRDRRALTDARGRARLVWTAPTRTSGMSDLQVRVTATREGIGSATAAAAVRVAADHHALSFAVEGGAYSPLGGYLFARLVGDDGRPAGAGIEIRASGPRLPSGGITATTDASGVAVLDVTLPRPPDASADSCGGESATQIVLRAATPRPVEARGCVPLDPDAAARVRATSPIVRAGDSVELSVDRVPGASRLPVELSVMTADARAVAVRRIEASESRAEVTIPEDATGRLLVRARPLWGSDAQPVRGGVTQVWSVAAPPFAVSAELSEDGATSIRMAGEGARSAYVVAAPIDEARALERRLRLATQGPLGELRAPAGEASPDLIRGALAAGLTIDRGAPAVLRGGRAVPVPAPSNPTSVGLLRDPWRSRARFVTGRLALIVRALEQTVSSAIPERIEDVAVRSGSRYRFNGQVLESVAQSGMLGPEGATGLGGDPLTIEQLRGFDPTISYDNVARRITRERLFRLILALRSFVSGRGFDLPWSRLGNPGEWMRQLQGQPVPGGGSLRRSDLVDGWGRPFDLRPARGGRSRFRFVDPLGAWEVVSSGPDGRFGGRDDVWDPTARVLRSGTPYAEAVGEDLLVARLQGVELGRASVALLQQVEPRASVGFVPAPDQGNAGARTATWDALPPVLDPDPDPLALRRPAHPGSGAGGELVRASPAQVQVALSLDEEPRTWGAVVFAAGDGGAGAVAMARTLAGAPLIVEARFPDRLRAGEPVELDGFVTNVTDAPIAVRVLTEAEGLEVGAPDELNVGAGEAAPITLRLAPARRIGGASARLRLLRGDEALRTVEHELAVVSGDHPLRLRAAGLARGRDWRVRFSIPDDARRAAGRVVLLAPSALAGDPDLADMRERDPALVAFSDALAGRQPAPEVRAALLRDQQPDGFVTGIDPMVSTGCAAVAWASAEEHDEDARAALARLRARFEALGGLGTGADQLPQTAAVLAAIATGGVPATDAVQARDPIARTAGQLRGSLRRALREHPEEPTLLARAAAALLLADPRDAYGRAMLERAAEHLTDTSDGGARVVGSERRDGRLESLAATLALAVAAHQVRQDELAERLARGGLGREHVALRAGGETLFWWIASGAYGVLGADAERLVVRVDGEARPVALEGGRAVVALDPRPGDHEVRVEGPASGGAFVRVEAALERPFVARDDGPYALAIEGDPGDTATGAALELSITARREIERTVVDLSLPAGAIVDDTLRAQMMGAPGVERIEVREPGFLRVRLGPMGDGVERTIPLPLRWSVRGTLRGLGAVAYPLGEPGAMSAIAPRELPVTR